MVDLITIDVTFTPFKKDFAVVKNSLNPAEKLLLFLSRNMKTKL